MLNLSEVLTSVQTTLNDDLTLRSILGSSGKGRIYIGPDFPPMADERFISLAILSNVQDVEMTEQEVTTLGVTIAVLAAYDDNRDLALIYEISTRVNTLLHNQPSAMTLTNDLIGHISREGSLPPDTDEIGSDQYLIAQERFELLTTTKG